VKSAHRGYRDERLSVDALPLGAHAINKQQQKTKRKQTKIIGMEAKRGLNKKERHGG